MTITIEIEDGTIEVLNEGGHSLAGLVLKDETETAIKEAFISEDFWYLFLNSVVSSIVDED